MKRIALLVLICAFGAGCLTSCREEPVVLLDQYETADVAARAWNFQVFPGARFRPRQTEVMRRAHFLLNPGATQAPPIAVYVTDASLSEVTAFYAKKYGYADVASGPAPPGAVLPTPAYHTSGDLGESFAEIQPLLARLDIHPPKVVPVGRWRGTHLAATGNMPRVSLQRPWVDFFTGETVDSTLILLVHELPMKETVGAEESESRVEDEDRVEDETAKAEAQEWNLVVFPGAKFRRRQTDLMKRTESLLGEGKEASLLAVYVTDASLPDVVAFYATSYGFADVASGPAPPDAVLPTPAYHTSGDLGTSFAEALPLLERLDVHPTVKTVAGGWRGAHFDAVGNLPRVSLQRPWVDFSTGETVDSTLIRFEREIPAAGKGGAGPIENR